MSSSSTPSKAESWEKLIGLIKNAKFSMMATATPDGTIHSRPMATQDVDKSAQGELWFFTGKNSLKVDEVKHNPHINLGYIGEGQTLFISVSGKAEVSLDKAKMKELYNPVPLKAWFPQGLDDPNMALIKVTVTEAEYWDNTSNKFVQLYGFAKAAITGEPHKGEGQDHEKLTIQK